jgi:tRNA(Ile)-lysidine synthase
MAPRLKPKPKGDPVLLPTFALLDEKCAQAFSEIVIGLSGGRDSVALLHALHSAGYKEKMRAVHVHHGLSPHAHEWAAFCTTLCKSLNVPFEIAKVSVETAPRVSVEAAARTARYEALRVACKPDSLVALAHHADDQIESFLLQLLRGAGPRGLAAMPPFSAASESRPALWRPLLSVTREDVSAYVLAHGLAHIEDDSNVNRRFKRNALRLDVLPQLEKHFPDYRTALLRSIQLQQTALEAINEFTVPAAQTGPLPIEILRDCTVEQSTERFRRWLSHNALPLPPASRTREAVRQLREITNDQYFRLQLGLAWELRVKQRCVVAVRVEF